MEETAKMDFEKVRKSLKNTGGWAFAIGWITILTYVVIYVWGAVDANYAEAGLPRIGLSDAVLGILISVVFIVLGNRIKSATDRNTKRYIQVLLGLSVAFLLLILVGGGKVGFLFFLLIYNLFSSLRDFTAATKSEEFNSTLTSPTHSISKTGWVLFVIVGIVLIAAALAVDVSQPSGLQDTQSTGAQSEWSIGTDSANRVQFALPGPIERETEAVEILGETVVQEFISTVLDDGSTYAVVVTTYPASVDVSNPDSNLQGALNGMAGTASGGRIVSSAYGNIGTARYLEFVAETEAGNMAGRIFLDGHNFYQVIVLYAGGRDLINYSRFLNAFRIL